VHSETIIVARDLIKAPVFYRIAAVLILVLDLGHTAGFPWSDLKWGVDLGSMRSTQFEILGCSRIYWDFYVGFGLFVAAFLLLAVDLAWQLAGLPAETLALLRGVAGRSPFALPPSRF
jgi:hypothetical protein